MRLRDARRLAPGDEVRLRNAEGRWEDAGIVTRVYADARLVRLDVYDTETGFQGNLTHLEVR